MYFELLKILPASYKNQVKSIRVGVPSWKGGKGKLKIYKELITHSGPNLFLKSQNS